MRRFVGRKICARQIVIETTLDRRHELCGPFTLGIESDGSHCAIPEFSAEALTQSVVETWTLRNDHIDERIRANTLLRLSIRHFCGRKALVPEFRRLNYSVLTRCSYERDSLTCELGIAIVEFHAGVG